MTPSTIYIKEIKQQLKQVKEALKQIEEAEKMQYETARNCRDYDKAKNDVATATLDAMAAFEEAVRLTSAIGSTTGSWDLYTCHKIVEYSIK